jgi:tetratricopeptide (TPR) repeat protein
MGRVAVVSFALSLVLSALAPSYGQAQETELPRLREAARASARDYAAQRALGMALLRAGHYREATTQLQRASHLQARSLEALYDVARVPFAQGDHGASEAACRAMGRLQKAAVLTQVCNARSDLVWNRSARAFEELNAALATEGTHYEGLLALGDAHRLRAAVPEAESAYQRAIAARSTEADPHLGLGRLYAAAGRRDDALRELRAALAIDPTYPDVQYELGRLLTGTDEGRAFLQAAVAGRPGWPEADTALGDSMLASGSLDAAETAYRAAIAARSTHAPAHTGLGRVLVARHDYAGAEPELRRAIELVPNDPAASLAMGDVLANTEREEEAFEMYDHAADLDPRGSAALLRAAQLGHTLHRDGLASAFLDRLLENQPTLAPALALYGDIARVRHELPAARDYYTRALAGTGEFDRSHVEQALRELH